VRRERGVSPRDLSGRRATSEVATNHIDWSQVPERSNEAGIFEHGPRK